MLELEVKVRLSEHIDPKAGWRTVRADITNVGEEPIDRIALAFEYKYETPQDVSSEFDQPPGRSIRVQELGRQIDFMPMEAGKESLQVGQCRTYLLSHASLRAMESVVESLSPERYWLAITKNGQREVAVSGVVLGSFVQAFAAKKSDANPIAEGDPERAGNPERELQTGLDSHGSADRMQLIRSLVAQIMERGQRLEILPPREFTHGAGVFHDPDGFRRLLATWWRLRLGDGREERLSYVELMALLSKLMMLRWQYDELCRTGGAPNELPVVFPLNVTVARLMTGEETNCFLSGLRFGEP